MMEMLIGVTLFVLIYTQKIKYDKICEVNRKVDFIMKQMAVSEIDNA